MPVHEGVDGELAEYPEWSGWEFSAPVRRVSFRRSEDRLYNPSTPLTDRWCPG